MSSPPTTNRDIVIDSSLVSETLCLSPAGLLVKERMLGRDAHLPDLAHAETLSTLRGWALGGLVEEHRLTEMVADLACFPARIWPTRGLDERVWSLRHNFSAYDATYVALAETLDAELLTADRRLHRATTTHTTCRVTLVEASTGR